MGSIPEAGCDRLTLWVGRQKGNGRGSLKEEGRGHVAKAPEECGNQIQLIKEKSSKSTSDVAIHNCL